MYTVIEDTKGDFANGIDQVYQLMSLLSMIEGTGYEAY